MNERPILRVVDGTEKPRSVTLWKCRKCELAGYPSGPLIEVALEAHVEGGAVKPGERGFACLSCHARGILTLI
jgi:hypothetical protein